MTAQFILKLSKFVFYVKVSLKRFVMCSITKVYNLALQWDVELSNFQEKVLQTLEWPTVQITYRMFSSDHQISCTFDNSTSTHRTRNLSGGVEA